ncbi:MAG: hypothetical protein V3S38_02210 [Acidimicrobiia bacterium]|nr:hypothetical protein [Actinomycetota bacterium]
MLDILLPSTDAVVALQFAGLATAVAVGIWLARRNRDLLRLVIGLGLLTSGLMAIRAIH